MANAKRTNLNRRVAGLILLAALDFKEGRKAEARKHLQLAAEDEDFDETIDGMNDMTDEATDPFLEDETADADPDAVDGADAEDVGDDGTGDLSGLDELLQGSVARTAKRAAVAAEDEKIGGNDGPQGADTDNNSDEEIRQVARLKQVRANLKALASVK